jgi:hypothetical protein
VIDSLLAFNRHFGTEVISRRELLDLPTWVVIGINDNQISHKYSEELASKLASFRRVRRT